MYLNYLLISKKNNTLILTEKAYLKLIEIQCFEYFYIYKGCFPYFNYILFSSCSLLNLVLLYSL